MVNIVCGRSSILALHDRPFLNMCWSVVSEGKELI